MDRSLHQEDPWRRKWKTTPVFFHGESQGQRSLVGYSPWGYRVGQDLVTKQQQWKVWRLLQALEEAANLTGWSWGGGNGGHAFLQHILNLLPLGIFLLRGHSLQQLFTTHPCSNYLLRIYCAPGVQATSVVLTLSSVFGPLISSPILQPIRCLHHRNCSFLTFLI